MRRHRAVARVAIRSVRQRVGRIALTVVAISLAVSFAVAGFGVSAQMRQLLGGAGSASDEIAALPQGSVIVTATARGATEPTAISTSLVERVAAVDGVLSAGGTYEQPIAVRIERGTQDDRPPALRGLVFTSEWDPTRWQIRDGSRVASTGDRRELLPVAMDVGGLIAAGASLGDPVELQTPTGGVDAVIVAVVSALGADGGAASPAGVADAHVVIDRSVLPQMLGAPGRVDRITAVPEPGVSIDDLSESVSAVLPDSLRVVAASDPTAVTARAVSSISGGVATATLGFALVSALIAALLVRNTFSIVVAQRRSEVALARCLGMSRRQAVAGIVIESAAIGALASVVGLLIGVPLSVVATSVLQPDVDVAAIVTPTMVFVAIVVGLLVTTAAGSGPAVRTASVPPVEALGAATSRRHRRGVWLIVVAPVLSLARLVTRRDAVASLAVAAPRHDPRRAAATVSTLCVGVALMAAVATVGTSISAAVADQFIDSTSAELMVRRRGVVRVDAEALQQRLGLPDRRVGFSDVATVDATLIGPDGVAPVVTSTPADGGGVVDADFVEGELSDLDGGAMLSVATAERLGVARGDSVTVRSVSGDERAAVVQGLYRNTAFYGPALVDRTVAAEIGAEGTFERAALDLPEGAPVARIRDAIDRRLSGFNRLGVDSPAAFSAVDSDIAGTVTRLALVLLSGSVLMGGLGAANGVSLSVLERRREFALLRTIGASPHQVRRLVSIEAALLCGGAGVLGAMVGAAIGVLGVGRAPAEFAASGRVPWVLLVGFVVAAILIGLAAATGPARSVLRRDPRSDLDST